MSVINQDGANNSIGRIRKHLVGASIEQLAFMVDRFDPRGLLRWLQDQARRNAAKRELDLLSDYCLDDIGAKRRVDLRTDDLVNRLRAGG